MEPHTAVGTARPGPARRPRGPSARPLCPASPLAPYRPGKAPARRALSVEDVSAPGPARAVGRLLEVFPDGTSQLQLQRPPEGTFGFNVASGNGRRDSGRPPAPVLAPRPPGQQQAAAVPSGHGRFCFGFSSSKSSRLREPPSEGAGILPSRRWRWQACPTVPTSILKSDSRLPSFHGRVRGRLFVLAASPDLSDVVGVALFLWLRSVALACLAVHPGPSLRMGSCWGCSHGPWLQAPGQGPARSQFSTGRTRAGLWTLASTQPC